VDLFAWLAMICGLLLGLWSIYNAATRPKPNVLDLIDLLFGLAIGGTLVAVGLRLRKARSPWISFLSGSGESFILFGLALLGAARGGLAQ
jgi:predicted permease